MTIVHLRVPASRARSARRAYWEKLKKALKVIVRGKSVLLTGRLICAMDKPIEMCLCLGTVPSRCG